MSVLALALAIVGQPAPAAQPHHGSHAAPAAQPAPAPPAVAGSSGRMSVASTPIATLLANPASRAIVDRHIPGLSGHPQLAMAAQMSLRAVMPYAEGMITEAHLTAVEAELAALPVG